ncbi:hypothetical protein [Bosea sp. BK604]|uniref:hypothetical protein n=1 Tax=Bosea sp. BK604 TaxID=2512180 RepID=UPI00104B1DE5|nr:hypothetical protein [Bosea sp. BK604]TCR69711.1 hypothetical protein EV560_101108 [Bosea sp. BK604]
MMNLREIVAEIEGAAQQEAAGIAILETTRFEPELARTVPYALAAAKRRAEALAMAAQLLRHPICAGLPGLPAGGARP